MTQLKKDDAIELATTALLKAGATQAMAASTARALVLADMQGMPSHGLSRVAQYTTHLRNGRANGQAVATVVQHKAAAALVDAHNGLAFPACAFIDATNTHPAALDRCVSL